MSQTQSAAMSDINAGVSVSLDGIRYKLTLPPGNTKIGLMAGARRPHARVRVEIAASQVHKIRAHVASAAGMGVADAQLSAIKGCGVVRLACAGLARRRRRAAAKR